MPIGPFLLVAFSYLVYRRANAARRNPWLWIVILWFASFAGAFLFGIAYAFALGVRSSTVEDLSSELAIPAFLGFFAGTFTTLNAAGRIRRSHSNPSLPDGGPGPDPGP